MSGLAGHLQGQGGNMPESESEYLGWLHHVCEATLFEAMVLTPTFDSSLQVIYGRRPP